MSGVRAIRAINAGQEKKASKVLHEAEKVDYFKKLQEKNLFDGVMTPRPEFNAGISVQNKLMSTHIDMTFVYISPKGKPMKYDLRIGSDFPSSFGGLMDALGDIEEQSRKKKVCVIALILEAINDATKAGQIVQSADFVDNMEKAVTHIQKHVKATRESRMLIIQGKEVLREVNLYELYFLNSQNTYLTTGQGAWPSIKPSVTSALQDGSKALRFLEGTMSMESLD